jgi:hypothetical protein
MGSDDIGRRFRDRFRFAGYMTGNAACSNPLGLQRKRRATRHGPAPAADSQAWRNQEPTEDSQAQVQAEDSRARHNQVVAEDTLLPAADSRSAQAPDLDNKFLGNTCRSCSSRAQRAPHRPRLPRPHPRQPERPSPSPNPSDLAIEPPRRWSAAPRF